MYLRKESLSRATCPSGRISTPSLNNQIHDLPDTRMEKLDVVNKTQNTIHRVFLRDRQGIDITKQYLGARGKSLEKFCSRVEELKELTKIISVERVERVERVDES